jgi:uncharacterized protein YndB with AHSA1/START domain
MPAKSRDVLGFTVFQSYRLPLQTVWEAATQARHLNHFFTTGAKGNITADLKPVSWKWKSAGPVKLDILECTPPKSFQFRWRAPGHKDETMVRFEFARAKGRTTVRIFEAGWKVARLDDAFDHCGGWSEFLSGLKAWAQHGVDLRK